MVSDSPSLLVIHLQSFRHQSTLHSHRFDVPLAIAFQESAKRTFHTWLFRPLIFLKIGPLNKNPRVFMNFQEFEKQRQNAFPPEKRKEIEKCCGFFRLTGRFFWG